MAQVRKGYPSDVTDEEWWFVLPYLLLCREDFIAFAILMTSRLIKLATS